MSGAPVVWSPALAAYVRRSLILAVLTFAITFVLIWIWDTDQAVYLSIGLGLPPVVTAIFLLEDFARWRAIRMESWTLEPPHLIHDGADGRAMIPLSEIDQARSRLGSVIITLLSGRRIALRYLTNPAEVAATLNGWKAI